MVDGNLLIFGRRLREIRLAKGLTQEALAEKASLHPTYIGGIERGERNLGLSNLLKLSVALSVSPSSLLSVFDEGIDIDDNE